MTEHEIHDICKKYNINNYTINPDGSIDVRGNVSIVEYDINYIPIKFNKVGGWFNCSGMSLTSLKGCPKKVDGNFYCHKNELTSLKGSPESVRGSFDCSNNKLTTLKGCPNGVGVYFLFNYNNLISLDGFNNNYDKLFCDNKENLIKKHKRSKKLKLIEKL